MNDIATIYQCPTCQRLFDGQGNWHAPRLVIPTMEACGASDCAEVAEANAQREREREARIRLSRRQRMEASAKRGSKSQVSGVRCQVSGVKGRQAASFASHSVPPETEEEVSGVKCQVSGGGEVSGDGLPAGAVTVKEFSQQDFEASGAAASANELFKAWFDRPENFGKAFAKRFLEDVVMQGKSGCCNNRAVDCRPHFLRRGIYIDNAMQTINGRLQSVYWACRIEDAVSLTDEQKAAFLTTDGHR